MTSSEPLVDIVLDTIRNVPAGTFFARDLADDFEVQRVRSMSVEKRLLELDALMLRAEGLTIPPRTPK